jgi:hypothetical protein
VFGWLACGLSALAWLAPEPMQNSKRNTDDTEWTQILAEIGNGAFDG